MMLSQITPRWGNLGQHRVPTANDTYSYLMANSDKKIVYLPQFTPISSKMAFFLNVHFSSHNQINASKCKKKYSTSMQMLKNLLKRINDRNK